MSYDFCIRERDNIDPKCPTCGHQRTRFYLDLGSPTYNIGAMFRLATGGKFKQGEPVPIREALEMWTAAVEHMATHPDEYAPLEPPNKWGSFEGAKEQAHKTLRAIKEIVERGYAQNFGDDDDHDDERKIPLESLVFEA